MKKCAALITILIGSIFPATAKGDAMLLSVGQKAPDFSLQSSSGDTVTLSSFRGKQHVVLIFYPGDETPGCTRQLCAIRDDYSLFSEKGSVVFGINPGDAHSHDKFIANHGFQFPLLIDRKRAVAKAYGCDGWPLVKRTVYGIGKDGTILFAKRGKPSNEEILATFPAPEDRRRTPVKTEPPESSP